MFKGIDLSSDTATKPTAKMKAAMMNADVGDEQKNEDPTTAQLEEMAATMFGFESATFLPSATMANTIAIATLCGAGEALLAAENSHLFLAESGGPAIHAGALCRPIPTTTGIFTSDDVRHYSYWRKSNRHPITKLISIENTSNFGGGTPWLKHELKSIVLIAKELGLNLHLDGSRIFNASIKTRLSVKEICADFDMITICLTKGLGCPIGALLIFNTEHSTRVHQLKHLMGGALRQSGIIAAAGIYALKNNISHLQEDHNNAELFAQKICKYTSHIRVINNPPQTNIILFEWVSTKFSPEEFLNYCLEKKLRFSQVDRSIFRAVTHLDIARSNIMTAINTIEEICL